MNSSKPDFQLALAHARHGRRDEAQRLCRLLLQSNPRDIDVLELAGVLSLERGAAAEALTLLQRAMTVDSSRPGVHFAHGNAALALGRHKQAVASYDRVLQLAPGFADALRNRGDALLRLGQPQRAADSYQAALEADPEHVETALSLADALSLAGRASDAMEALDWLLARSPGDARAWTNRGNILYAMGRLEDALADYDRAIALAPRLAEPHDNRGMVLLALGLPEEAIASHAAAIRCNPEFAAAHLRRAMALRTLGRFREALEDAERALALETQSPLAWNGRGVVHSDLGEHEAAVADFQEALRIDPKFAEGWNNLGNALHDLGRYGQARVSLERALELRPGYAEALSNLGLALQEINRLDDARAAFDAAIAARPRFPEALKRRAGLRLLQGDYAGGWDDYNESLARRPSRQGALHAIPQWNGESLRGKSILLSEPNGYGDVFQYWRFLPVLRAMGAEVAFLGDPKLFRLLGSSGFSVRYLAALDEGDRFDYRCELWEIPRVRRLEPDRLPASGQYLHAEPAIVERWAGLLEPGRFNIGIAWQGKPGRKIDEGRSVPLRAFAPLADVPGVCLVSLQRGHGVEQLADVSGTMRVIDPGEGFDDGQDAFVDTAGLMASLDLVVSSDTAIAHLAGALGRPTWVALKQVPEWRWMLERSDTPWYPGTRLFRQTARRDWDGVFARMREELASRTRAGAGPSA